MDATTPHLHYYNLVSGRSFKPEDVNDFYIYRLYGWNPEELEAVYARCGHDIHWNSVPLPMAVETLQRLYAEHTLTIITSRPERFRQVTADWLQDRRIAYHRLVMTEDKLGACLELNVDVLIDDGPHYAEAFAQANRPVILYDQPYNRAVTRDGVLRASDWTQVQQHIEALAIG